MQRRTESEFWTLLLKFRCSDIYCTVRRGSAKTRCEARLRIWMWRHRCRQKIREAFPHSPKRMNFRKSSDPKNAKLILQTVQKLRIYLTEKRCQTKRANFDVFPKISNISYRKWEGGQRSSGTFPKSEKSSVFVRNASLRRSCGQSYVPLLILSRRWSNMFHRSILKNFFFRQSITENNLKTSQELQMLSLSVFIQRSLWMLRLLFSIVRNIISVSKVTSL